MEIAQKDMEHLREIELNLLKSFIHVCKKLSLRYFVVGGTMLGAIRHKGFIPWDDDIDVAMPREDYEIFCRTAQDFLAQQYFVQTHVTDPEYILSFAKLRDSNTTFIETSMKEMKINHGVYIDIFPIDFYPDQNWAKVKFGLKKKILQFRFRKEFVFSEEIHQSFGKKIAAGLLSACATLCYPNLDQAFEARETLYCSCRKSSLKSNFGGAWGKKEIMPATIYDQYADYPFETITVKGVADYDAYLQNLYGNYMKFPPEEQREPHHFTEVIDLTRPYTDYCQN